VTDKQRRVAAVVLAAGMSTRMEGNKLLAQIEGEALVRRVVRSAEASRAQPIIVVTGHEHERVKTALAGIDCRIVHNSNFREGLSTSLQTGIRAVGECDGAIILLGDMPVISSSLIDKMISALDPENACAICVATFCGRRGNPVLFDRRFFPELQAMSGDVGARDVVAKYRELVCEVEAGNEGPLIDLDTSQDLERFLRRP
jgi:molybdenum cofactor cytidylyltransferase